MIGRDNGGYHAEWNFGGEEMEPPAVSAENRAQQWLSDYYAQAQQGLQSQAMQYYQGANILQPQPIMVRLSDEDIQRVVKGILDGMQERWGRRTDDEGT